MAKKTTKKRTVSKKTSFNKKELGLFVLIFAAVGAVTLWVSFAAPAPPATLVANPNPATVGSSEVFTGCGYQPNKGTTIVINSPYATSWFGAPADAQGCIDSSKTENFTNQQAGTYKVNAWQVNPNNSKKSKIYGSVTYSVQ